MAVNLLKARGQVSIEYILLLIIMLIYIQTIIQPILGISIDSAQEISSLGQARASAEKLVNAVDFVSLSTGSARQEVAFYLPPNASIACDETRQEVRFSAKIAIAHEACQNDGDNNDLLCTKSLPVLSTANINCRQFGTGQVISGGENGKYYSISVRKIGGVTYVEG